MESPSASRLLTSMKDIRELNISFPPNITFNTPTPHLYINDEEVLWKDACNMTDQLYENAITLNLQGPPNESLAYMLVNSRQYSSIKELSIKLRPHQAVHYRWLSALISSLNGSLEKITLHMATPSISHWPTVAALGLCTRLREIDIDGLQVDRGLAHTICVGKSLVSVCIVNNYHPLYTNDPCDEIFSTILSSINTTDITALNLKFDAGKWNWSLLENPTDFNICSRSFGYHELLRTF